MAPIKKQLKEMKRVSMKKKKIERKHGSNKEEINLKKTLMIKKTKN